MSDSKAIDQHSRDVDDLNYFQMIFDELLKSNISVITLEAAQRLSDRAVYYESLQTHDETQVAAMKTLLMICNVLYGRTDMLVLPVDDGVYDLLLESYKKYDPHFQVGSAVVQFRSQAEQLNPKIKEITCPLVKLPEVERDEMRQAVFHRLSSFDQHKFTSLDFHEVPPTEPVYISKREHNTKHHHPELVGTLDKCKFVTDQEAIGFGSYNDSNVKILERDFFQKHIAAGIITPDQDLEMILELKYDGVSVEADCGFEVESARSRGDTGIGEASDMTPILKGYRFPYNTVIKDPIGIKFEAIMTKSALEEFNRRRQTTYANCRTAIVGLFGASDAYLYRDLITLVPLAVDRNQVPEIKNRMEEIEFCNRLFRTHGEPLRSMYIHGTVNQLLYQIKKFADEAYAFRDYADFMFDGIVVSYLDEGIRQRLGRENYINKFSMAVKFNPLSKMTRFVGYSYEVGQDGRVCPMIHYLPVEFFGTNHNKSTGSSLSRFKALNLKVGDIIKVTYVNDVMPYVNAVDCKENRDNPNPVEQFPTHCPVCGSELVVSPTGKTAYCPNLNCDAKVLSRMVNMLQKMNIKGFAESTIKSLGVKTFYDLMQLTYDNVAPIIGPGNASNLMEGLNQIRNGGLFDYILLGSLGFTGIASNTWKLIFSNIRLNEFVTMIQNYPQELRTKLIGIHGIGSKAVETIMNEYPYYARDIDYIIAYCKYRDTLDGRSLQIRFSGCRNLQLSEQLINLGCDAQSNAGVSKKTDILIVPYEGYSSKKVSKVSDHCKIVAIDDFMSNMQKYLQ